MTITANRWGWRHSPCVLVCRRHIPEMAWEKVNEAPAWPERLQNRIPREVRGGDQWWCRGPFCRPGLMCASRGHMDSCLCIRSHQPSTHPHLLCYPHQKSVPAIFSLFWGISSTVGKPGIRQLPAILCSNDLPPPHGLFSGRTPAVSCNYRFAGLLLTPRQTPRSEASPFYCHKGAKLMEPREAGGALEQQQRFPGKQNDCWFIKNKIKTCLAKW